MKEDRSSAAVDGNRSGGWVASAAVGAAVNPAAGVAVGPAGVFVGAKLGVGATVASGVPNAGVAVGAGVTVGAGITVGVAVTVGVKIGGRAWEYRSDVAFGSSLSVQCAPGRPACTAGRRSSR